MNLQRFVKTRCGPNHSSLDYFLLKALIEMTAELAASLLSHNLIHRDFQPRNILVTQMPHGPRRLLLADLEAIWPIRRRARHILRMPLKAHLATRKWPQITRTLRLRFLLEYMAQIHEPPSKWKSYWLKIDSLARHKHTEA
jgi:hypothetical protein